MTTLTPDRLAALRAEREAFVAEHAAWNQRGRHDALARLPWHAVAALAEERLPRRVTERHRVRLAWLADDARLVDGRADQLAAYLDGVRSARDEVIGR